MTATLNRSIENEYQRDMAIRLIQSKPLPITLTITEGKVRTTAQNRTQHLWFNEISQQKGDETPRQIRAYCKLHIGVPILRNANEAFRVSYDRVVKSLPYETKLAIMDEPLDLPVTSLMTTKQLGEYLDGIFQHFSEQGIVLSIPEDLKLGSKTVRKPEEPKPQEQETSGELPASVRNHLIDFARKGLSMANATADRNSRSGSIQDMLVNYKGAIDERHWPSLEEIMVPLNAVLNGRRTIDQAREYLAKDILKCNVNDLISRGG